MSEAIEASTFVVRSIGFSQGLLGALEESVHPIAVDSGTLGPTTPSDGGSYAMANQTSAFLLDPRSQQSRHKTQHFFTI